MEDLLAVETEIRENNVDPNIIRIQDAPPGFPGERLTKIKPASKEFQQKGAYIIAERSELFH